MGLSAPYFFAVNESISNMNETMRVRVGEYLSFDNKPCDCDPANTYLQTCNDNVQRWDACVLKTQAEDSRSRKLSSASRTPEDYALQSASNGVVSCIHVKQMLTTDGKLVDAKDGSGNSVTHPSVGSATYVVAEGFDSSSVIESAGHVAMSSKFEHSRLDSCFFTAYLPDGTGGEKKVRAKLKIVKNFAREDIHNFDGSKTPAEFYSSDKVILEAIDKDALKELVPYKVRAPQKFDLSTGVEAYLKPEEKLIGMSIIGLNSKGTKIIENFGFERPEMTEYNSASASIGSSVFSREYNPECKDGNLSQSSSGSIFLEHTCGDNAGKSGAGFFLNVLNTNTNRIESFYICNHAAAEDNSNRAGASCTTAQTEALVKARSR